MGQEDRELLVTIFLCLYSDLVIVNSSPSASFRLFFWGFFCFFTFNSKLALSCPLSDRVNNREWLLVPVM